MFFNGSNYWKMSMQVFNFAAFSLATYDQMTNPNAKLSENGLDMFVHAMSFLSLHENASFLKRLVTSGANMMRLGASYAAVTSDCSDCCVSLLYACRSRISTLRCKSRRCC